MNGLTFRAELQRELTLRPFSLQRFLKEPLGSTCIARWREQKINRVASGIPALYK